ncbi:MAG TPA: sn-glycerol-3-phosphate ABC transporter ATP-binding protein UgpC [Acidimicrobiales bacterium]|nr:sn-glycerol-3-phosphate ABC transporter ATP-binding protein UgpC [Acidimicrobiales bacterium]
MARIAFDEVDKVYPDGTAAVSDLTLDVNDGEFMVLVGPSGCGKTTALRMVAGLEDVSDGIIHIGDRVINDVPAKNRDIAMVFQSYALYPHMTVFENMAFGLRLRKVPNDEIDTRVRRAAGILGIEDFLSRKPRALSGGQRQRVAMGRAIVREPKAFLMDEPLSNLDAKLRVQMRAEISALQRELAVTTLYVTHDQVEAMTMGDRVAVIRKGELQQVGTPSELYDEPVNLFVAGFIGSPAMNMVTARLERHAGEGDEDQVVARFGDSRLVFPPEMVARRPAVEGYIDREVVLGIRPEDLEDAAIADSHWSTISGEVRLTEALGSEIVAHFDIAARPAVTEAARELAADVGDEVAFERLEQESTTFVGRFGPRSDVKAGERIEVAVDTRALHVFDPGTALAIYRGGTQ